MTYTIPIEVVRIEPEGCHLLVAGSINSHPVNLLIDTGASQTVLNKKLVASILPDDAYLPETMANYSAGIGTNNLKSESLVIEQFCIGDFRQCNYKAILLDMQHVTAAYHALNLPLVGGILGGDILLGYHALIDYRKKLLLLKEPSKQPRKRQTP